MTLPSNGDGSAYVKYSGRNVVIGAGGSDVLTVGSNSVTVAKELNISGDLSASGDLNATKGQIRSYTFTFLEHLQLTYPFMTASILEISGAAALHGQRVTSLAYPMRQAGSIVGISLYTPDGVIKSGALTGTVFAGSAGTTATAARIGANTGSVNSVSFAKDVNTFSANDLLRIQLTSSSGYLCEPDVTSASFIAVVDVEY